MLGTSLRTFSARNMSYVDNANCGHRRSHPGLCGKAALEMLTVSARQLELLQ